MKSLSNKESVNEIFS